MLKSLHTCNNRKQMLTHNVTCIIYIYIYIYICTCVVRVRIYIYIICACTCACESAWDESGRDAPRTAIRTHTLHAQRERERCSWLYIKATKNKRKRRRLSYFYFMDCIIAIYGIDLISNKFFLHFQNRPTRSRC